MYGELRFKAFLILSFLRKPILSMFGPETYDPQASLSSGPDSCKLTSTRSSRLAAAHRLPLILSTLMLEPRNTRMIVILLLKPVSYLAQWLGTRTRH